MGYERHHAILISSWDDVAILRARRKAKKIFPYVSPISPPQMNNLKSFFIPPDGSKEQWEDSFIGDKRREEFIEWLKSKTKDSNFNNDSFLTWAEVMFFDDDGQEQIIRKKDTND